MFFLVCDVAFCETNTDPWPQRAGLDSWAWDVDLDWEICGLGGWAED